MGIVQNIGGHCITSVHQRCGGKAVLTKFCTAGPEGTTEMHHKPLQHQSEMYSVVDKSLGDEVKFFEVKTKDLLGRDFKSTKNFIVKLEGIASRFLTQIAVHQRR